jgi:putative transposase
MANTLANLIEPYHRVGHVFQGRYKGIHVEKESYLLELSRYVVLNPVRAFMVRDVFDWLWSNYRATIGYEQAPSWLHSEWILSVFGSQTTKAIEAYKHFVSAGRGHPSPWLDLRNQAYLGSEHFVANLQAGIGEVIDLSEIPRSQRRPKPLELDEYKRCSRSRNDAITKAYASGGYTLKEIGTFFDLHYTRVSRIISMAKDKT